MQLEEIPVCVGRGAVPDTNVVVGIADVLAVGVPGTATQYHVYSWIPQSAWRTVINHLQSNFQPRTVAPHSWIPRHKVRLRERAEQNRDRVASIIARHLIPRLAIARNPILRW